MLLQRLATGATGVKQARYRRRPTRGSEPLVRACAVYTQRVRRYRMSLALAVHNARCNACIQCLHMNPPRVLHFSAIHVGPVLLSLWYTVQWNGKKT